METVYISDVSIRRSAFRERTEMVNLRLHCTHAPDGGADFVFEVLDLFGTAFEVALQPGEGCVCNRARRAASSLAGHRANAILLRRNR